MDQTTQINQAVAAAIAAAHQGPLGVGWETWIIVFATFTGPVIAILASLLLTARAERRSSLRSRRLWVFRTLLATRGQAITQEHVGALNLIEIEYYGVPHVMTAWRTYMDHLNSPGGRVLEQAENLTFNDKRTDLLAKLLRQISLQLGFEMSEIDLKRGGYAPSGWAFRDEQEARLKFEATKMFAGESPLRVLPWEIPATQSRAAASKQAS